MERAVIIADQDTLLPENLPSSVSGTAVNDKLYTVFQTHSLKEGKKILERLLISKALKTTSGNKSRASELLEISYPALLSKIKELGIE